MFKKLPVQEGREQTTSLCVISESNQEQKERGTEKESPLLRKDNSGGSPQVLRGGVRVEFLQTLDGMRRIQGLPEKGTHTDTHTCRVIFIK